MKTKNHWEVNTKGVKFVCEQLSQLSWAVLRSTMKSYIKEVHNTKTDKYITLKVKASEHKYWSIGTAKFNDFQWDVEGIDESVDIYILVDLFDNAAYIVPTHELRQIITRYAPAKYDKRRSRKGYTKKEPQPCWINASQEDHSDEWQEIAQFKNRWDLLNVMAKSPTVKLQNGRNQH